MTGRRPKNIGQAVRAERRARDLTQEQLAARAGVVPTCVTAIECNRRSSVKLETLHQVTASLGCHLELVDDDDELVPLKLSKKTVALLDQFAKRGLHGVEREDVAKTLLYSALRAEMGVRPQ